MFVFERVCMFVTTSRKTIESNVLKLIVYIAEA